MKDNTAKIHLICAKAQEALQHEKRLLITVPTLEAAQYIDALLWRIPEESFIPHRITDTPTSEWVTITLQEHQNIHPVFRIFNLCPISSLHQQVKEIYDLYDETHPQKMELSQQRLNFYQSKGFFVKSERYTLSTSK